MAPDDISLGFPDLFLFFLPLFFLWVEGRL